MKIKVVTTTHANMETDVNTEISTLENARKEVVSISICPDLPDIYVSIIYKELN